MQTVKTDFFKKLKYVIVNNAEPVTSVNIIQCFWHCVPWNVGTNISKELATAESRNMICAFGRIYSNMSFRNTGTWITSGTRRLNPDDH